METSGLTTSSQAGRLRVDGPRRYRRFRRVWHFLFRHPGPVRGLCLSVEGGHHHFGLLLVPNSIKSTEPFIVLSSSSSLVLVATTSHLYTRRQILLSPVSNPSTMVPPILSTPEHYLELIDSTDTFLLDCDGVIYHGPVVVEGVREVLALLRAKGKKLIFVTNNARKSRAMYKKTFDKLNIEVKEVSKDLGGGRGTPVSSGSGGFGGLTTRL